MAACVNEVEMSGSNQRHGPRTADRSRDALSGAIQTGRSIPVAGQNLFALRSPRLPRPKQLATAATPSTSTPRPRHRHRHRRHSTPTTHTSQPYIPGATTCRSSCWCQSESDQGTDCIVSISPTPCAQLPAPQSLSSVSHHGSHTRPVSLCDLERFWWCILYGRRLNPPAASHPPLGSLLTRLRPLAAQYGTASRASGTHPTVSAA